MKKYASPMRINHIPFYIPPHFTGNNLFLLLINSHIIYLILHRKNSFINRTTINTANSKIQQKILWFRKRIRPFADTSVYRIIQRNLI